MADNIQPTDQDQVKAAEEEARFKKRLKDEYGIEEDAESFKGKRTKWEEAERAIPQYQSTLDALVEHTRTLEASKVTRPVQDSSRISDEEEEERIRTIAKLDPYEGMKRVITKLEKKLDERFTQAQAQSREVAQGTALERETLRRSADIVRANWPEAFDQNTELFKVGHRIFNQEMSDSEKADPRSFLIATERAAGRLGIAPKGRRGSVTKRSEVSAQNVSRQGATKPSEDDDDKPLTARQKFIVEKIGVNEKTYRLAQKNRKAQLKKSEEEEE